MIVIPRTGAERAQVAGPSSEGCLRRQRPSICAARAGRRRCVTVQALGLALPLPLTVSPSIFAAKARPSPRQQQVPKLSELSWATNFEQRYILGKKLGTGSYGTCYVAIDRASGRAACVKIVSKTRGKQSREKVLRKLAGEADYLMRVQECPGIVQLFETYEDADKVYFVCELCSGGDLEHVIESEGPLQEVAVARVLYEVLKVVATCHSHQLVHGDVKPANFVLKTKHASAHRALQTGIGLQGAWLKAVDFGCSQASSPEGLNRRTGTPVFMAPEVYARKYGMPADLWSCGIMMYQLLAGRFPFWETYEECRNKPLEAVVTAVVAAPIPLAGAPWLKLSPLGMDFLSGLLVRDPEDRLTAYEALEHPWFRQQLGRDATSTLDAQEANNIVPLGTASPASRTAHQPAAAVGQPAMRR